MQITTTKVFEQNAAAWLARKQGVRRALNEGGTSSSKTYSILQLLILIAEHAKTPGFLISAVSESVPHLKRGAMRDFQNILGDDFDSARWNKTDSIYSWPNAKIEFFSADTPSKLRGGRRKILFINELNNIPLEAYHELDIRTELFTFADWNPVSEFYAHERLLNNPENRYIHSTYKDALNVIPPSVVKNIEETGRNDPNWANVYQYGHVGKVEGLVYPVFEQVDELPAGDAFYGLDFGYSNDPTGLTKNIIQGERLYTQELIYEAGLTNQDIAAKFAEVGVRKNYDEIFADAAEPKSIEEIFRYGFNIKAAPKGEGSIEYGHQRVRQFKQFVTKDSLNLIKELRNFRYIPDKSGKLTEKTTHLYSHLIDSRRYGLVGKLANPAGKAEDAGKGDTAFSGLRKREF